MKNLAILKRFIQFIIYSNLFISACALLMAINIFQLFPTHNSFLFFGYFLFFSTLASYNVHWYLTDPATERTVLRSEWLAKHKKVHFTFACVAGLISLFLLFQLLNYWKLILPLIFFTLLYSAPKFPLKGFKSLEKYIFGKTILLTAVWTYATTLLPLLMLRQHWIPAYTFFCVYRFTLIFAVCILFDIRDKEFDKNTGIKSLVTLLSGKIVQLIFSLSLIINVIAAVLLVNHALNGMILCILLIPSVITFFLYPMAIKSTHAMLFYLTLDGIMALSPVLFYLSKILPL